MTPEFSTLRVHIDEGVIEATISAPPMNLLGPELVRDLATFIPWVEEGPDRVVVFKSAHPDYFIPHVDVNKVAEYRAEAAKLVGEASIGLLFRRMSEAKFISIAQIEGRVRGAGSEFILACDMAFASRERAIFSQMESAMNVVPGAGGVQHLTRLLGRKRALEIMLGADDHDAELAERYGWINRALPQAELSGFVTKLARRIASCPHEGQLAIRERVNAIALAPAEDFRIDSDLFGQGVGKPTAQKQIAALVAKGFQNPTAELSLGKLIGELKRTPADGKSMRKL